MLVCDGTCGGPYQALMRRSRFFLVLSARVCNGKRTPLTQINADEHRYPAQHLGFIGVNLRSSAVNVFDFGFKSPSFKQYL